MKSFFSLFIIIFFSSVLFAQNPAFRIYLADGSTKVYNLTDLQNLSLTKSQSNATIKVYYSDSITEAHNTSDVDSIRFEMNKGIFINFVIYKTASIVKTYLLAEVDSINFFIPAPATPQITNINPTALKIGDEVIISGKNFGASRGTSIVSFGTINAINYTSWNDTEIRVKTPDNSVNGKLSVTVNSLKSNLVDYTIIVVPKLNIVSVKPTSVNIGDVMTITGTGFGSSQGTSFVSFNSIKGSEFSGWTDSLIKVKVPANSASGKLSVTVNSIKSNEVDFTVLGTTALIVSTISPVSVNVGDLMTISGIGFDSVRKTSYVTFGSKTATGTDYVSWSNLEIKVKVPVSAKTGSLNVGVGSRISNSIDYFIIPKITKLLPDSAAKTEFISIIGSSFGAIQDQSTVSFNGGNASEFQSWSDTLIVVKVPTSASTGKLSVTVNNNKSNEVNFTLVQMLLSVNPASANLGDEITITGTNFGSSQGTSFVSFNSVKAITYKSWNDSVVKVVVPASAFSGMISLTIGKRKSNELDFIVIPKLVSLNPTSGRIGSAVTLTGTSFGDSRGNNYVSFCGVNIFVCSVWNNTTILLGVDQSARTGKVSVSINNTKSNELDFTVLPSIIGFNPNSGLVGDQVTIRGICFGASQGTSFVSFNGTHVTNYISWNDTVLVVLVPAGTTSGKMSATINGVMTNEFDFVMTPHVTSISPTEGALGTTVTITGENFGASRGSSVVNFPNASTINYQSWSNTQIVFPVPSTGKSGKVSVTVSGIISNEVDFTTTTVMIGSQEWMIKNLNVTTYRNGDAIPEVTDGTSWQSLSTGARCSYNNDGSNDAVYGKLYNWFAVNDSRGLAPTGWHIATNAEWASLVSTEGGNSVAGGPLKETGTTHWSGPNTGATNESGFTGLPGGYRLGSGTFQRLNELGLHWTTSTYDASNAYEYHFYYNNTTCTQGYQYNGMGLSVRCVKD
ncbi:MAG: IPT/TIG domain-containing protein [Candidatus Kapabacteria bacterium]|nr:IPT/TIG domain-containing protein [Candidatus Kapabacteria bacterium]